MAESILVVAGADTHADTVHLAAVTMTGASVGDRDFPATRAGYTAAIRFLTSLGQVERIGVEGTASYGVGLTRALIAAGIEVVEVTRAVKSTRRLKGKSDPLDAYSAARTALAGDGLATPKGDATAGLRALHIARRSAVKHRTAVINQLKAMLVSAPDSVREKYRGLTPLRLIEAIVRCRPDSGTEPWAASLLVAAKTLAQRVQFLESQAAALEAQIDALVTAANPGLRAAYGVGADTAAQLLITAGANPHRLHSEAAFAVLCGTAPVPASSGKTNRHRLCRGGYRAANNALFRIALVRMSSHRPTKDYVQRQQASRRGGAGECRCGAGSFIGTRYSSRCRGFATDTRAEFHCPRPAGTRAAAGRGFGADASAGAGGQAAVSQCLCACCAGARRSGSGCTGGGFAGSRITGPGVKSGTYPVAGGSAARAFFSCTNSGSAGSSHTDPSGAGAGTGAGVAPADDGPGVTPADDGPGVTPADTCPGAPTADTRPGATPAEHCSDTSTRTCTRDTSPDTCSGGTAAGAGSETATARQPSGA
ncbi:IS110 family transposase [Mycobacterium angelicum]|uniref:Uncharacterized protein n=1 Tax=Mycobacterium angelicum TaxID=470074 RepID=A0A1W9ZET2_MYCAN|nr:IS110 family transposase [Mycobacterium angelicum]MCV7198122.1 IS110 family transposase [Mycobacterium angelicum]ORA13646.1 hypothetical protein BST12_23705 [Mycobacterium angelicum]